MGSVFMPRLVKNLKRFFLTFFGSSPTLSDKLDSLYGGLLYPPILIEVPAYTWVGVGQSA